LRALAPAIDAKFELLTSCAAPVAVPARSQPSNSATRATSFLRLGRRSSIVRDHAAAQHELPRRLSRPPAGADACLADAAGWPLLARVPSRASQGLVPRVVRTPELAAEVTVPADRVGSDVDAAIFVLRHPRGVRRDGCRGRVQPGPQLPNPVRTSRTSTSCAGAIRSTSWPTCSMPCAPASGARRSCAADRILRGPVHRPSAIWSKAEAAADFLELKQLMFCEPARSVG